MALIDFHEHLRSLGCNCDPELADGTPVPRYVEVTPETEGRLSVRHDDWCPVLTMTNDRITFFGRR